VLGQVGALREVLAQQAVGVLVGAAPLGPAGVGEKHSVAQQRSDLLVVGHFRALVPGEGEADRLREFCQDCEQCVADGLGGPVDGQVDQSQVAAGAIDQGGDRGLVLSADDEVALPGTDTSAVQSCRWSVFDQQSGSDEPTTALVRATAPLPQGPAGAQPAGELAAESALAGAVERLVDRLVTDVSRPLVGMGLPEPCGDLLRAPILFQLGLDNGAQAGVGEQPSASRTAGSLPGSRVDQVGVIDAAVVRAHVAAQLPAHGRW
jgi:hypothetical protein